MSTTTHKFANGKIQLPNGVWVPAPQSLNLPAGQISPAKFNPVPRTEMRALKNLREGIEKYGILSPIQILHRPADGYFYVIVDGHRRYHVAVSLGMGMIPSRIHTYGEPEELWAELNRRTRPISANEWLYVWRHGRRQYIEPGIPSKHLNHIKLISEMMGPTGADYLLERGAAPYLASLAKRAWEGFKSLGPSFVLPKAQVARWAVDHRLQQDLKLSMVEALWTDKNKKIVWSRCQNNQPFSHVELH